MRNPSMLARSMAGVGDHTRGEDDPTTLASHKASGEGGKKSSTNVSTIVAAEEMAWGDAGLWDVSGDVGSHAAASTVRPQAAVSGVGRLVHERCLERLGLQPEGDVQ